MYSNVFIFSILSLAWSATDLAFSIILSRTSLIGLTSVVVAIALISFTTTVILFINNRKPESKHPLTRVSTHYYSMLMIAFFMFVIGIPLIALTPAQCRRHEKHGKISDGMLCGWLSATIAYVWSCAWFSGMAAYFIRRRVNNSNLKGEMSTTNIASLIRAGTGAC